MQPLNENFILKEIREDERTTKSGIIIASGVRELSVATIFAMPDSLSEHFAGLLDVLSIGDKVIFSKYAQEEIIYHDEEGKEVKGLFAVHCSAIQCKLDA